MALQALMEELRRDLEDEELAKIVLETLDILCSSSLNENEEIIEQNSGIEVQFCEILLKVSTEDCSKSKYNIFYCLNRMKEMWLYY